MAEYIDKNAVFELIRSMPSVDMFLPVEFMKRLYALPAADVAPVVRCKDCSFYGIDQHGEYFCTGAMAYTPTPKDFFCAMGKRRADNG